MLHLQHNTTRTSQDTSKRLLLPRRLLPLPLTKLLASTESSSSLELPPQSEQRPSQTLLHGNTTAEFVTIPLPLRHNSTATTRRRSTKTRLLPRLSRSRALSSTHLDPATILEQIDTVDLQHSYLDSKVHHYPMDWTCNDFGTNRRRRFAAFISGLESTFQQHRYHMDWTWAFHCTIQSIY